MNLTPLQKATIQAIVNIFETGSVRGDYSNITRIPGDTGGLTYGRSQTTRASGNLHKLVDAYVKNPHAKFASDLRPFLHALETCDPDLDRNEELVRVLRLAGRTDPAMRSVQDAFFDKVYFAPALAAADARGIRSALGMAVVYDGHVHGSWERMADRTDAKFGTVAEVGDRAWIRHYVPTRRAWLAGHPNAVLHATVYRMDAFANLIAYDNWLLALPLSVRGLTINAQTLGIPEEHVGWQLFLGTRPLCQTWQNKDDDFRNYAPVRPVFESVFGVAQCRAKLGYPDSVLMWDGKPVQGVPVVEREGTVWAQVRALAAFLGLTVDRDTTALRLVLRRPDVLPPVTIIAPIVEIAANVAATSGQNGQNASEDNAPQNDNAEAEGTEGAGEIGQAEGDNAETSGNGDGGGDGDASDAIGADENAETEAEHGTSDSDVSDVSGSDAPSADNSDAQSASSDASDAGIGEVDGAKNGEGQPPADAPSTPSVPASKPVATSPKPKTADKPAGGNAPKNTGKNSPK